MKNKQKCASAVSIIGGADGPTSVFLAGKGKRTIKQKFQKAIYQYKRKRVEKTIKAAPHTMEQVREYAKSRWGYTEMSKETQEYQSEYAQLRASFIMQYAPELLGELAERPNLEEHTEEALRVFVQQMEERQKAAEAVPVESFDIDFCILVKENSCSQLKVLTESRFGYIGGSASGDKRQMKEFHEVYRDIYRYYGVSQNDIDNQTKRYKELVGGLAR